MKNILIIKHIVKAAIGIVFIVSAVSKLISIDEFEIYIFNLKLFSLSITFVLARLIIALELFLGLQLLLNIYRYNVFLSLLVLSLFSFFLIFKVFKGDTENCHCFGEMMEVSPLESLIKNVILIVALFWVRLSPVFYFNFKRILTPILILVCLAIPNIASPPDFLYFDEYSQYTDYNEVYFKKFESVNLRDNKDKKILCFLSATCKYCKLAAKKVSTIVEKHGLSSQDVLYVFSESNNIETFLDATKSNKFNYITQPQGDFLKLTNGSVPLVLLYSDSLVVDAFMYRNIDETRIVNFLK